MCSKFPCRIFEGKYLFPDETEFNSVLQSSTRSQLVQSRSTQQQTRGSRYWLNLSRLQCSPSPAELVQPLPSGTCERWCGRATGRAPCLRTARAHGSGVRPKPPRRQHRGKSLVSSVDSHTDATRIGWHLWEIDLRLVPALPETLNHQHHSLDPLPSAFNPEP